MRCVYGDLLASRVHASRCVAARAAAGDSQHKQALVTHVDDLASVDVLAVRLTNLGNMCRYIRWATVEAEVIVHLLPERC